MERKETVGLIAIMFFMFISQKSTVMTHNYDPHKSWYITQCLEFNNYLLNEWMK